MAQLKIRQHKTITIRRDDHIGDPVGTVFLDPEHETEEMTLERVARYLGPRLKILKLELTRESLVAEVESFGLAEESRRLSDAAESLRRKGALRNAQEMFKEALKLDPLNGEAQVGLGILFCERKQFDNALPVLRRAREIAGDRAELLQRMAEVCVQLERTPTAIGYLEEALGIEPHNPAIRRALNALGRTPPPAAAVAPRRHLEIVRTVRKG